MTERIERELTEDQRTSDQALLGTRFDLARSPITASSAKFDAGRVATALIGRGGQRLPRL